jgi:adenylate kinase family enzyme
VGSTGSGKTTFARELARRLGVLHIELDALHWDPGWVEAPLDVFRARVSEAVAAEGWVCDGNYSRVRDIVWSRVDTVVWLDYPFRVLAWRLLCRSVRRSAGSEELWNGNRESWRRSFLSRDSVLLWLLRSYRRHRRDFDVAMSDPAYSSIRFVRLRSPRAAERWLARITPLAEAHT